MVTLDKAVLARLEVAEHKFELLVDPDLALKLKKGEQVSFNDLLATDTVYKDAKKGDKASPSSVQEVFKSVDIRVIAEKIIKDGEVQLTTEQRRHLLEQKRKEVIDLIARNAINPQTNSPHPPQRIENAINESKVSIDLFKPASDQVPEIVEKIKHLIPISMEQIEIALKIPAEFSSKTSSVLHGTYNIKKEEWQNDGSVIIVIELPSGLRQELLNEVNHLTHGNSESKIIEKTF